MEITGVRMKIAMSQSRALRAFCSATLDDCIVLHEMKLIAGKQSDFVAMPSRKHMDRCEHCSGKNQLQARYCQWCGTKLQEDRAELDRDGRPRLFADIVHPVNAAGRALVHDAITAAYRRELQESQLPGYSNFIRGLDYERDDIEDALEEVRLRFADR